MLYCKLIKKVVALLEHEGDQIRNYLDELINVTRALIMDPAPEVQVIFFLLREWPVKLLS